MSLNQLVPTPLMMIARQNIFSTKLPPPFLFCFGLSLGGCSCGLHAIRESLGIQPAIRMHVNARYPDLLLPYNT